MCMANLEIKGLWTGKTGAKNPQSTLVVDSDVRRFFYNIESSEVDTVLHHVTRVFANGIEILKEMGDIKPGDPDDAGFFDIPMAMRTGVVVVEIGLSSFEAGAPQIQTPVYTSPQFTITYTAASIADVPAKN